MSEQNLRELSKGNYTSAEGKTFRAISTGSLQRIADSIEIMTKRHSELIRDNELLNKYIQKERAENDRLRRSNSALRGHYYKLKKQINGKS